MNTFNPTVPATNDFRKLSHIWRTEAEGREALGAALRVGLGSDLGLAVEAGKIRHRAQNPQQIWPLMVLQYGPSSLVTIRADRLQPEGLYGPLIAKAAATKLIAATCCDGCQSALRHTAKALQDFGAWIAQHIHPSQGLAARAAWDVTEADHLAVLAKRLRTEVLAETTTGVAS